MAKKKPITWTNEKRKLSDLIPWELNPKHLTEKQAGDLLKSIRKFGLAIPFNISEDNLIYDGHGRKFVIDTLLEEWGKDVEVAVSVSSRKFTKKERAEFSVRTRSNLGDYNFDMLANIADLDELDDWGLSLLGSNPIDHDDMWEGMPEFDQEDLGPMKSLTVNFSSQEDYEKFANLIEQKLTMKSRSIWYPKAKQQDYADDLYSDNEKQNN